MSKRIKEQLKILGYEQSKTNGHAANDIARYYEDTKHMIIIDVFTDDCPVGCQASLKYP